MKIKKIIAYLVFSLVLLGFSLDTTNADAGTSVQPEVVSAPVAAESAPVASGTSTNQAADQSGADEEICTDKADCEKKYKEIEEKYQKLAKEILEINKNLASDKQLNEDTGYLAYRYEKLKELKNLGNEMLNVGKKLHSFSEVKIGEVLKLKNQTYFRDVPSFLGRLIDLLISFAGVASLGLIIFGGFRIILSAGNDNEIQKAKVMIEHAVIGLVVALLAYLMVALLRGVLYQ